MNDSHKPWSFIYSMIFPTEELPVTILIMPYQKDWFGILINVLTNERSQMV